MLDNANILKFLSVDYLFPWKFIPFFYTSNNFSLHPEHFEHLSLKLNPVKFLFSTGDQSSDSISIHTVSLVVKFLLWSLCLPHVWATQMLVWDMDGDLSYNLVLKAFATLCCVLHMLSFGSEWANCVSSSFYSEICSIFSGSQRSLLPLVKKLGFSQSFSCCTMACD